MKKLFSLFVAVALSFVLYACNDDDGFVVDVFIYEYSDTYIGTVRAAIEDLLKKEDDITFHFHDAASSQDKQMTDIDNAIARGTDLLVVNIVEVGSGDNIVKKAKDNDIPIIFFNREVSDSIINSYDDEYI